METAKKEPVVAPPTPAEKDYALLGLFAWHLSRIRPGRPFWFPTPHISPC